MKFDVWCPDLGSGPEDARTFEAFDAEHAATEWAHWEDGASADYWIVGGQDARVCVKKHCGGKVHEFLVQGRTERAYSAHALPDNVKVRGPTAALSPEAPSRLPGCAAKPTE